MLVFNSDTELEHINLGSIEIELIKALNVIQYYKLCLLSFMLVFDFYPQHLQEM